jgi:hypothetical protein
MPNFVECGARDFTSMLAERASMLIGILLVVPEGGHELILDKLVDYARADGANDPIAWVSCVVGKWNMDAMLKKAA